MSYEQRLNEHTRNLLIELVKQNPSLYNHDAGGFSQEARDERGRIWDSIGQTLSLPADMCKAKFTNLRNNYMNNLRNNTVSDEMKRRLNFLDEFAPWNKIPKEKPARITQRRATKRRPDYNEDSCTVPVGLNQYAQQIPLVQTNTTDLNGNGIHPNAPTMKKKEINHTATKSDNIDGDNVGADQNTPKIVLSTQNGLHAEPDDLTSFFKSMEQTCRKFNGFLQLKVKRMISDIIYDAEESWLNNIQD